MPTDIDLVVLDLNSMSCGYMSVKSGSGIGCVHHVKGNFQIVS